MEADLYVEGPGAQTAPGPTRSDLISGAIGEDSDFHATFGYYAEGVGRETPVLPDGWEQRLAIIDNANTGGVAGLCLDLHDAVLSKYARSEDKDLVFIRALIDARALRREKLEERIHTMPEERLALVGGRAGIAARIARDFEEPDERPSPQ